MRTLQLMTLTLVLTAGLAFGQGVLDGAGAKDLLDTDSLLQDEMDSVLDDLTPDQMKKLIEVAAQRSLQIEREQVASEITQNILYDEEITEDVAAALKKDPKNTQADNIERIFKAFSKVDDRVASAWKLYQAGKYDEAAAKLKPSLNPEDASYASAALHFLHAESLNKAKKTWPALQAYSDVLVHFPDRISFSASAALTAGQMYDKMGRGMYAMEMYNYALQNYQLVLPQDTADAIYKRFNELKKIYEDPLTSLTGMMQDVQGRLASADLGEDTRTKQKQVVGLLEDLIKTAEEKNRQKQQQQQKQQQRQKKKGEGEGEGEGKGKGKGQGKGKGKGKGKEQGKPGMTDNPTGGAKSSSLVPGPVSMPNKLAQKHQGVDSGKWAQLSPRERQRLHQLMQQKLGQRRTGLVKDYHTKMAEGEE